MIYAFLADLIVVFHFCYVLFTVGGELLILLGALFRWGWIRQRTFRIVHLFSVLLVAGEALVGILCPLTEWEYNLRERAGQTVEREISFIARLLRAVIFYDFPWWVFLLLYTGFGLLVLITFFIIPPRKRGIRG